jgi:hypothetical protein
MAAYLERIIALLATLGIYTARKPIRVVVRNRKR